MARRVKKLSLTIFKYSSGLITLPHATTLRKSQRYSYILHQMLFSEKTVKTKCVYGGSNNSDLLSARYHSQSWTTFIKNQILLLNKSSSFTLEFHQNNYLDFIVLYSHRKQTSSYLQCISYLKYQKYLSTRFWLLGSFRMRMLTQHLAFDRVFHRFSSSSASGYSQKKSQHLSECINIIWYKLDGGTPDVNFFGQRLGTIDVLQEHGLLKSGVSRIALYRPDQLSFSLGSRHTSAA